MKKYKPMEDELFRNALTARGLTVYQAEAMHLVYYLGKTVPEAAKAMNAPVESIKSRLRAGKKNIAEVEPLRHCGDCRLRAWDCGAEADSLLAETCFHFYPLEEDDAD